MTDHTARALYDGTAAVFGLSSSVSGGSEVVQRAHRVFLHLGCTAPLAGGDTGTARPVRRGPS